MVTSFEGVRARHTSRHTRADAVVEVLDQTAEGIVNQAMQVLAMERRSGGRPLPLELRLEYGHRLGESLETVRVHDDASAARSAEALNADAALRQMKVECEKPGTQLNRYTVKVSRGGMR